MENIERVLSEFNGKSVTVGIEGIDGSVCEITTTISDNMDYLPNIDRVKGIYVNNELVYLKD